MQFLKKLYINDFNSIRRKIGDGRKLKISIFGVLDGFIYRFRSGHFANLAIPVQIIPDERPVLLHLYVERYSVEDCRFP